MPTPNIRQSDPSLLSDLLHFEKLERPWQPAELEAVLRHQLAAPVEFDLAGMGEAVADRLRTLAASQGLVLKSVGDLLRHPHPPIELLEMLKDFAKAHVLHPRSPLPREIAAVLYYASIFAAMSRCDRQITKLDSDRLRAGVAELLPQEWLDQSIRALFIEGLCRLSGSEADQ
jgi:hypothetical protein